jgi:hypothetical protein
MSSKRWDLTVAAKDKSGNWRSNKVGVIFEGDKGQLQIRIDPGVAISSPEGVLVTGWLPKERDDGARNSGPRGGGRAPADDAGQGDDSIPF